MRFLLPIILVALLFTSVAFAADAPASADSIIENYLKLPFPESDIRGEARSARLDALRALRRADGDIPAAIAKGMAQVKDARQRAELIEALRDLPSKAAADVCIAALADPSQEVRYNATHCLWLFARKVDKAGPAREQRSPQTKPLVEGLVPHLLKAADDAHAPNRTHALYALADTLDPAGVERLRAALKDADREVRFAAACLLTEFNDASGLGELRAELNRLRTPQGRKDVTESFSSGRLIASMTRITGKSFGKVPMNPMLSSDSRQVVKLEAEYHRLIEAWGQWWDWEPGK